MVRTLAHTDRAVARFGSFEAVRAVSFRVDAGEILGLLGANGAGKTTLIRLLLGLLGPSSGTVALFGQPPSLVARRNVGYVPQALGLYDDLSVEENWRFARSTFGVGPARLPEELQRWHKDRVGALPLGVQRQVAFAVALSHRPELLILDEPTSGVGVLSRARLWDQIRQATEHGAGALVSTHNMEEAEQCDRLMVMVEGAIAVSGTLTEVVGKQTATRVQTPQWRQAFDVLDGHGLAVVLHGATLRVSASPARVRALLSQHGIEAHIDQVPASLEEAFVTIATSAVSE